MQAGAMDSILGSYEEELKQDKKKTGDSSELGKQQFLELLTTQLEHQDPLNPMNDKEFVAQLAQFSSLEQLTNISSGVDDLNKGATQDKMLGAVNYIGKKVLASGEAISKNGENVSPVRFSLEEPSSKTYVNVLDGNGNVVQSSELGAFQAGDYTYQWDGQRFTGEEAPNGEYTVNFAATDANGKSVMVDKKIAGEVVGVEKKDGAASLVLNGGRSINLSDVKEVISSTSGSNSEETG